MKLIALLAMTASTALHGQTRSSVQGKFSERGEETAVTKRSRGLFPILTLAVLAAGATSRGSLSQRVDAAIRAEVARGFSGAVLVTRSGQALVDRGYGSLRGSAVRKDSRFWIASVGKSFTSAAVLLCRDRGLLTLDDPLSRFFPEAPADKRGITVRQLLSHTSGFGQSYVSEDASDRATAVTKMLAEPLTKRPGEGFQYSNTNYQLAVAIVEVASGRPYHQFVREELWSRADLRNTGFAGEPGAREVAAVRGKLPSRLTQVTWGGEGLFSTTADLARWYRALRSGPVLSRTGKDDLFAPVARIGEGETALGWFVGRAADGSERIFTRGNEDFGANALLYAYPESDTVVVVLTHAGDAGGDTSWSRRVLEKVEKLVVRPD